MSATCPACQRLNPVGARYCYYDGVALGGSEGAPIAVGSRPFLMPFVFPSGRNCRTFDELVRACESDWDQAREMLRNGFFQGFLGGLGRADLALAARQAAQEPDLDQGLDSFLARLPGQRTPPALSVSPREINLGTVRRDEKRTFILAIENTGMGLLTGAARSDVPWLVLGGDGEHGTGEKHFSCRQEIAVPVRVRGAALRAGVKPQEGKIVVEAGNTAVPIVVRVVVPVVPFPEGILAGATTPRQLAEKARDKPREAAALFESGAVPRWYESNGWTYPVQGPAASGKAAVQQYFEALGLTRPPKLKISQSQVDLVGAPGGSVEHFVFVETPENRPVYARAVSETHWLEIARVKHQGNSVRIHLRVPRVPPQPGERLHGRAVITSNGNQKFVVEVALQVQGQSAGRMPPPVRRSGITAEPAPEPAAGPALVETAPLIEVPAVEALPVVEARPLPGPAAAPPAPAPAPVPVAAVPLHVEAAPGPVARSNRLPPPVRRGAAPPAPAPVPVPVPAAPVLVPVPPPPPPPPRVEAPAEPHVVQATVRAAPGTLPLGDEASSVRAAPLPAVVGMGQPRPATTELPPEMTMPRRGRLVHLLPLLLILLVVGGTVVHDLLLPSSAGEDSVEDLIDPTPVVELHIDDKDRADPVTHTSKTLMFGLSIRPTGEKKTRKRLMYNEFGRTNNVCIRIDEQDFLFGQRNLVFPNGGANAARTPVPVARWVEMSTPLGSDRRRSRWCRASSRPGWTPA